ncbi:MAG: hypothetical protein ACYDH4_11330 [Candidatus Cryosericum sp.]
MARRRKSIEWQGAFGVAWSPVNQAYFVLFSPKHDVRSASVVRILHSREEAESIAGFHSSKRTKTRRSR